MDGSDNTLLRYVTTKYFTANPREQGELAEVAHSWDMVEVVFAPVLGNVRYYQRAMKCSEVAAYAEACLAMAVEAVVIDMGAEREGIHAVAEAMAVASEKNSLAPAMEAQGVEVGESSWIRIELDSQVQRVSDDSAEEQVEQVEKIRCSENLHRSAEGSLRTVGQLPNSNDLAGIVQVEVKVWTP